MALTAMGAAQRAVPSYGDGGAGFVNGCFAVLRVLSQRHGLFLRHYTCSDHSRRMRPEWRTRCGGFHAFDVLGVLLCQNILILGLESIFSLMVTVLPSSIVFEAGRSPDSNRCRLRGSVLRRDSMSCRCQRTMPSNRPGLWSSDNGGHLHSRRQSHFLRSLGRYSVLPNPASVSCRPVSGTSPSSDPATQNRVAGVARGAFVNSLNILALVHLDQHLWRMSSLVSNAAISSSRAVCAPVSRVSDSRSVRRMQSEWRLEVTVAGIQRAEFKVGYCCRIFTAANRAYRGRWRSPLRVAAPDNPRQTAPTMP